MFESSHFGSNALTILAKFYIKDATKPRNSPYTFDNGGFYKVLKRKVTPILDKVGKGPTKDMLLIQDSLFFFFLLSFFASAYYSSYGLMICSGNDVYNMIDS